MPGDGEQRPPRDEREEPPEIEIVEVVGVEEDSSAPPAKEEVEISFDDTAPSPPAETAEAPAREDAALRERLVRLQADFENLKKRVERERDEFTRRASVRLVTSLLPVVDNLERAVSSNRPEDSDSAFRAGVELIHRQLLDALRREGLRPVEALGRPFDPNVHEAVATETTSGLPPNTVIEELQRGYLLHERLLRPALVCVSIGLEDEDEHSGAAEEA